MSKQPLLPKYFPRTGDMHKYALSVWLRKQTRWQQDA